MTRTISSRTGLPSDASHRTSGRRWWRVAALIAVLVACGCASTPEDPIGDSNAIVMVPISQTGVRDRRAEFRNVFCTVLETRMREVGNIDDCEGRLLRLSDELPRSPDPVDLGVSNQAITVIFIAGLGSDCVDQANQARDELKDHLARFGYHFEALRVSGISSSQANARTIRDALQAVPELDARRKTIIVGHSKGVVDALEALVNYPELQPKITAVISLAGAIGGSPLADTASGLALSIAGNTPGLECKDGDGGALESLSPSVRRNWLANNPLPQSVRYYSVVGLPTPERISIGLRASYNLLSDIDPRNDGNLLFYDQVIPGSTLLGYVNADHWAISANLGASPYALVRALADKSDFPRAVLLEAALRFVELDLTNDPDH